VIVADVPRPLSYKADNLMVQTMPQNGSSAPSINDQNAGSEAFLWEVTDKPKEQSATEEPPKKEAHIDGDFYKRVGFFSAFNKSSEQEFRRALEKLHSRVEQNIQNLQKELDDDLDRFKNGKADADSKITEIKATLERYEQQVAEIGRAHV